VTALVGLSLASHVSRRSEYELLAQAVDEVLPVWRDANGGLYFDLAEIAESPRRVACVVKGCPNPHRIVSLGLCQTHYKRYLKGTDISERIHIEKARGAAYVPRMARREPMRPTLRPEEAETLWSLVGSPDGDVARSGGIARVAAWAYEDRQAEQLGTPEIWQEVADQALERVWQDLMDGSFERRLKARLAAIPSPKPRTVQSPIMGVVQP
jgi:hypothetical protein